MSKGTMKKLIIKAMLVLAAYCARGQGTLQFDQQVSPTTAPGAYFNIQPDPTGESFVPTLSSVGFAEFYFSDPNNFNGTGATISVNLWSGSIGTGTLLGTTASVSMPDVFTGQSTFFFSTPVTVNPGTTYYLQPVIQSGDSFQIGVGFQTYANGTAYFQGNPDSSADLWFREGMVVPEPSPVSFAAIGFISLCAVLRRRRK